MKKSKFTEIQIIDILKQQETGRPVADSLSSDSLNQLFEVGAAKIGFIATHFSPGFANGSACW
jgi:hypothetical protein